VYHPGPADAQAARHIELVLRTVNAHVHVTRIGPDGSRSEVYTGPGDDALLGTSWRGDEDRVAAWDAAIHPADRERYDAAMRAAREGEAYNLEYRLVGVDAVERWVWESAHVRRDVDGTLWVDGIAVDVTDRHAAEQRTDDLRQGLRRIADGVEEALYTINLATGAIIPTNDRFRELFASERSLPGTLDALHETVHPDDRALVDSAAITLVSSEHWHATYRIVRPDGTIRFVRERILARRTCDREPVADAFATDITTEVTTRTAAQEADARLQRILATIDDVIFSGDLAPDGVLRADVAGPGFGRLLGGDVPDADDVLAPLRARILPDDQPLLARLEKDLAGRRDGECEIRVRGYDNTTRWLSVRARPRPVPASRQVDGVISDISDRRRASENLERASRVDTLTGVYSRHHFVDVAERAVFDAPDGQPTGIALLDIDRLKQLNDTYGHVAGDAVLVDVAETLRRSVRGHDTVARWGGDEFIILCPGAGDEQLGFVAERIRAAVADSRVIGERDGGVVTVSCGVASMAGPGAGLDALADAAERALSAAKRRGRNQVRVASNLRPVDMEAEVPDSLRLAEALALFASVREGVPELHCRQVSDLAGLVAQTLALAPPVVLRCRLAGYLHDIGKITIADAILAKRSELTSDERRLMQAHSLAGRQLLERVGVLADAAAAVGAHHERWDGTGYPEGLNGEQIPIEARIIAAVDAWSAMTEDRVYRHALNRHDATAELRAASGTHLDPRVVDALLRVISVQDARVAERLAASRRIA
jgi:diguanylate cyclase (GGDEF)-like protein